MGCDIHVFVEVLKSGDCSWLGSGELVLLPRIPSAFEELAQVRGSNGDAPRGLPPDASTEVREALERDYDAHSMSWCTIDRWREVSAGDPAWLTVAAYAEAWTADRDTAAVRIVFWFDN